MRPCVLMGFKMQTVENLVKKGEIVNFEQFHLDLQCFPKAFFFNVLK